MEITLLSAQGLNNTIPSSSFDVFASTHHLESIPRFFIGLTTPGSDSEKWVDVVFNWGDEKTHVAVEPSFLADSSSCVLLRITRLGTRLMFIGPRQEEVLWCRIPVSDVGFPVSFLSYRMRSQRDGSKSDVVVNLRVESGRRSKEMRDLRQEMAPYERSGHGPYRPSPYFGSVAEHGAVIGIPAIKPF